MGSKSDIYQFVIQEEIIAQNLYKALRNAANNESLKVVFSDLIQIEKNHEEKITELFKLEFSNLDLIIDNNSTPEIKNLDDLMTTENILFFAIKKEEEAEEMYLNLAANADSKEQKILFEEFAADERDHKQLLEDEILHMDGILTWFDTSELNGMMEE